MYMYSYALPVEKEKKRSPEGSLTSSRSPEGSLTSSRSIDGLHQSHKTSSSTSGGVGGGGGIGITQR